MTSPWNKRALGAQSERSPSAGAITLQPNRAISGLRWWILALIFLVTCINYIDRSSVGLLVTHFGPEIGISGSQYGLIGALLLFAYTLSGGTIDLLSDAPLYREGNSLVLEIPPTGSLYVGETVQRRLHVLAGSLGAAPVVRRRETRRMARGWE